MKKVLSLLLVLVMAMSLLVGCGGDADTSGDTQADNNGEQTSNDGGEQADGEVYEMVYQMINFGFDSPDLQMVEDALNEITVPKIGVKVKIITTPIAEMATKLGLMVSGNEKIDLAQTGLLTTPSNLVAEGLLMDITEYIEGSEILSSKAEGLIDACKIDGKIYAYPANLYPANSKAFLYDGDFAEEYGIEMPERFETAEDWTKVFEQVKATGADLYPISLGDGNNNELHWNYYEPFSDGYYISYGAIMDPDNSTTIENWYATEEYMEKCKQHREWFLAGYTVPDSISNGINTVDSITNGSCFGSVNDYNTGSSLGYYCASTGKNIKVVPVIDPVISASSVINASWGIPVGCENPEKVIAFLELLYTDPAIGNLLNLGIEGVHYSVNEGSMIVGYPEGVDASNVGYGNLIDCYGDKAILYAREPLTDEFIATLGDYGAGAAKTSKFLGYSFDTSSVATEVTSVIAVIGQYGPALSCGTVDPETTVPEFIEALEAAGINEIIAENQRQLDEWLAQQ